MRKKWICFLTACTMVLSMGCARTGPAESGTSVSASSNASSGTQASSSANNSTTSSAGTSKASQTASAVNSSVSSAVTDTPTPSPTAVPSKDIRFLHFSVEYQYLTGKDGENFLYSGRYPSFSLSDEDASKYALLGTSLKNYSEALDAEMKSTKDSLTAEARAAYSGDDFSPYYYNAAIDFKRTDSVAASFLETRDSYTGGAHNDTEYTGRNFNTQTGGEMKLTDVIPDISTLPDFLTGKLQEKYPDVPFTDLQKNIGDLCGKTDGSGLKWTLGYYDLTFYFSPSAIAPYASGLLTVTIPFSQKPELFNPLYTTAPESCVIALRQGETQYIYPDGSSTAVEMTVNLANDSEEDFGKRIITLGTDTFTFNEDQSVYSVVPYFLHFSDGRNYLYLSCSGDNDYQSMEVYQIEGENVSYVGNLGNAGAGEDGFIDPGNFSLSSRLDILSTYGGQRRYHIANDGMPAADEDVYHLSEGLQLTSKADVVGDILDGQYQVAEKDVTVPSGTGFTLSRTDGETFADAILSDGRLLRLYVDTGDGWPQTVNGQDIENLFDGLRFAG